MPQAKHRRNSVPRFLLLAVSVGLTVSVVSAVAAETDREKERLLFGFLDRTGGWAISPRYDDAQSFSQGLAVVKVAGKYGAIDRSGVLVIEAKFDSLGPFAEGKANARYAEKWGYIDRTGVWVLSPQFKLAWGFSEGLAAVKTLDGANAYIDRKGRAVFSVPWEFERPGYFKEGRATFLAALLNVEGEDLLNRKGVILAEGREGLLGFKAWGGRAGFLDLQGRVAIPPRFPHAGNFSEGLASAAGDDLKFGFINAKGDFAIAPQYDGAHDFSEGLAAVGNSPDRSIRNSIRWGFIDHGGRVAVPIQEEFVREFHEGACWVMRDSKWRAIDTSGRTVIDLPAGHMPENFSEGFSKCSAPSEPPRPPPPNDKPTP